MGWKNTRASMDAVKKQAGSQCPEYRSEMAVAMARCQEVEQRELLQPAKWLKILPIPSIHAKPAVLVARAADRPFWVELVFNLDRLPLC